MESQEELGDHRAERESVSPVTLWKYFRKNSDWPFIELHVCLKQMTSVKGLGAVVVVEEGLHPEKGQGNFLDQHKGHIVAFGRLLVKPIK